MCSDKLILYCFGCVTAIIAIYFLVKKIGLGESEIEIPKVGKIKTGQTGIIFFLIGSAFIYWAAQYVCKEETDKQPVISNIFYRDSNGDGYGDKNDFSKVPKDGYVDNSDDTLDHIKTNLKVIQEHSTHKWLTSKCASGDTKFNTVVTLNLLSPLKETPKGRKKVFVEDDANNNIVRFANGIKQDEISHKFYMETSDFDNKLLQLSFTAPSSSEGELWSAEKHKLKFSFYPIESSLIAEAEYEFTICCNCDDNNCKTECGERPIPQPQRFSKTNKLPDDKTVAPGGTIIALYIPSNQITATHSYHLTTHLPFYKNHKNNCPSVQPNHYSYVTNFSLYEDGKEVPVMRDGSIVRNISVTASNMITDAPPLDLDIIIPSSFLSNGLNLQLVVLSGNERYYSSCDENKIEPLVFKKGGYINVERID